MAEAATGEEEVQPAVRVTWEAKAAGREAPEATVEVATVEEATVEEATVEATVEVEAG